MAECSIRLQKKGRTIGFVPTMGYLHEGHLSLMKRARKETDTVVISIFVNPAQFGPREDFKKYPRDFKRDNALARSCGVDTVFYPSAKAIYPPDYHTYVNVERLTEVLCGASRPGHFRGVATVVAKLFNIVRPDIAYFGRKDIQQAVAIKHMVKDLNMPVRIKIMPTVREPDGLAMSSRNAYLSGEERKDALVLYRSLLRARALVRSGSRDASSIKAAMRSMIGKKKSVRIDYVSIVDARTLGDIRRIHGKAMAALAVKVGATRLIDNMVV